MGDFAWEKVMATGDGETGRDEDAVGSSAVAAEERTTKGRRDRAKRLAGVGKRKGCAQGGDG